MRACDELSFRKMNGNQKMFTNVFVRRFQAKRDMILNFIILTRAL